MCQPVLVIDSQFPTAFAARARTLGFRLADIRDPVAKVRDQVFTTAVIWDSPVTYRALGGVPSGERRFRALDCAGEMRLHAPHKGTLRNMLDLIGFLQYCFGVDQSRVRYHRWSGGFTIRQDRREVPVPPPVDTATSISTATLREAIIEALVSPDYAATFIARLEAEGIFWSDTIDVNRLAEAVDHIGDDTPIEEMGLDYGVLLGVTTALSPPVFIPDVRREVSHG
ncbi:MAG: hypothetical protein WAT81_02200 [Candidatus Moraniibacteriota bacterium]